MLLRIVAASAVLALAPVAAQAQEASPPPPSAADLAAPDGARAQLFRQGNPFYGDPSRVRRAEYLEWLDRRSAGSARHAARVALAERLAPLLYSGQCAAAIDIARVEKDRAVAYRIQRGCVEGQGMRTR